MNGRVWEATVVEEASTVPSSPRVSGEKIRGKECDGFK